MKIDLLQRVKDVYKDKYTIVNYTDRNLKSDSKLEFLCEEHGVFSKHLYQVYRRKEGFPKCSKKGVPPMTNDEFIKRLNLIHNGNLPYKLLDTYSGYHSKMLIEYRGVKCMVSAQHLLKGYTGTMKTTVDKTGFMILQFKDVHGDRYDYSNYIYKGNRALGSIICKEHGSFLQMTDVHLMGSGCPICGIHNRSVVGFSRTSYVQINKDRECIFYVILCYNENEQFFKIGITNSSVKRRYRTKYDLPYNYIIITELRGSASEVWDIELSCKRTNKQYRYKPKLSFKGSTECFTVLENKF